jgi:uncharacterized membrane protein
MSDKERARITLVALALVTVGLLVAYYGLRSMASQCSGTQCDAYIPVSLLLPGLILVMATLTGLWAIKAASRRSETTWWLILGACALAGVVGPVVSLVIWRDHPDTAVTVAALLLALIPVSALSYSLVGYSRVKK